MQIYFAYNNIFRRLQQIHASQYWYTLLLANPNSLVLLLLLFSIADFYILATLTSSFNSLTISLSSFSLLRYNLYLILNIIISFLNLFISTSFSLDAIYNL